MSFRLDQALDEVIKDRQSARGNSGKRNNSNNNSNSTRSSRSEHGGGGIRKRGNNNNSDSPVIRSFVRTVNVVEERRGGASKNVNGQWSHDMFDDDDVPRSSVLSRLGSARGGGQGGNSERGVEICVENLHYNVTEDDLRELFNTVGDVTKAKIMFDQSGRSTGLAYVSYQLMSEAEKAINKYNNIQLDGQAMQIKISERAPPKPRSSGGRFHNDRLSSRLGGRLGGSNSSHRSNNDRDNFRRKRFSRSQSSSKNNSDKKGDRQKKVPTAEDLDKEMESYMQSNASASNGNNRPLEEDIEMMLD
ncbi:hypothetical protein [Parasitella parasitica]|uniref:RRM domain-containing protein n=1 Tax=Parasitella parasitica TaxID=35722 RepID=A0A0B7MW86_9FUNG|nr:hypothetical protein [Parasitella parasitica]